MVHFTVIIIRLTIDMLKEIWSDQTISLTEINDSFKNNKDLEEFSMLWYMEGDFVIYNNL